MRKITLHIILMLFAVYSFAQVQITKDNYFSTSDQLLLANEINESGEPFAEFLGYNLDNLDPMVPNSPDSVAYTLGIENYEYSRYLLGTVVSRSGIGLHMVWAPVIGQMASMEPGGFDGSFTSSANGYKEDDELMKNIMHFSMLANQPPPMNPWPQFAEFASGDPHLPQAPQADFRSNFASLRWDRSKFDKTLNLAAMGQSLQKQYLWAQDMLGGFHDSLDNGIEPDGIVSPDSAGSIHFNPSNNVFYGGNNIDGFIGQVLTAEAINKTAFLINQLAYDGNNLGAVNPASYDPANGIKYFPHKIAVTESMVSNSMPPKPTAFAVTDASSDLFDQLSYLWGTLGYKNMMDPNNSSDPAHLAYHAVFDGDPFPAPASQTGSPGPFDLMMGTSKVLFLNISAMHFNSTSGTLVNKASFSNGTPLPGNEVSAVNAGYGLSIISEFNSEFQGTPLAAMSLNMVNAQAQFVIDSLKDPNGGYYNGYTLGTGPDNGAKTAEAQAAIARGLYIAYDLTKNSAYLSAANDAYNYLIANFYVPAQQAFRTTEANDLAVYTPRNFAIIAGGLREASMVGSQNDAAIIYTRFFKTVGNAMQFDEFQMTGESGSDSDGDGIPYILDQPDHLAPAWAAEAQLNLMITGVRENELDLSNVILFPNPAKDIVNIRFSVQQADHFSIGIRDITGKLMEKHTNLVFQEGEQSVQLNTSDLESGVYLIQIEGKTHSTVITKKLSVFK